MAKAGERVAILMIKDQNGQVRYGQIDENIPETAEGKVLIVHPDTRWALKKGLMTGAHSERKYDLSTVLKFDMTEQKDETYFQMLDIAQDVAEETIQRSRFGKNGLSHQVAARTGLVPADINCMLRAVRAEMAMETVLTEHRDSLRVYGEGMADILALGQKFKPNKKPEILRWLNSWSGGRLADLNKHLSRCPNFSKSVFLPFEIAAFRRFYEERMNNECGLSSLDKILLNGRMHVDPKFGIQDSYQEIYKRTGLWFDDAVATRHLNVLRGRLAIRA